MTEQQAATFNRREMEHYIIDAMDRWEVPGLSITIVKDGETVVEKGYGTREVGKDLPVDAHTLFAVSGTTASFTAAALAILVSEGKMDWNDRIVDLLPGFKTGNDLVSNHATVIDALANRTGLPMEVLSFLPHPDLSRADIVKRMEQQTSGANDFRASWGTNIVMNVAAGEIIPALTGLSWDDFVSGRLFAPLGMTDSVTGPHLFGVNQNVVTPHETEEGRVTPVPHGQTTNIGPGTSIYSSAADMTKWLNFQLNNGKIDGQIIIPEDEINKMRTSYIPANFELPGISKHFLNQGLGILISDSSSGYKVYSGGGDSEGMESCYAFVPELNLGVAVMINSTKVMPQPLIAWIIDRYTNAPCKDWVNDTVPVYVKQIEDIFSGFEKQRQAITDPSKKPARDIASFAGLYRHALYGDLKIELIDNSLSFTLGTAYKGDLHHANHDTFFIEVKSPHLGKFLFSGAAQFRIDETGQISSLFVVNRDFKKVDHIGENK